MPIYEYKCDKCGKFEKMQRMSDAPLTTCPKCGGPVKKLISHNVGIIFKGPGFYCTDSRPGEYRERSREDKAADT